MKGSADESKFVQSRKSRWNFGRLKEGDGAANLLVDYQQKAPSGFPEGAKDSKLN
jgi:hypothetical protein